jgi:hypothetical protein
VKAIPDVERQPGQKGIELSKVPIDLKSGDWSLKLVPWIGGRVISMTHHPSGKFYCFKHVTWAIFLVSRSSLKYSFLH